MNQGRRKKESQGFQMRFSMLSLCVAFPRILTLAVNKLSQRKICQLEEKDFWPFQIRKKPCFVLRIAPNVLKILGQDWYQIEALFSVVLTHPANPRGNGLNLVKNAKEKGSENGKKWTWKGRIGGSGQWKKVRTLLYQFFVPNPAAHSKISKTCRSP